MEFCEECGSMMRAEGGVWECSQCGHTEVKAAEGEFVLTQGQEASEVIDVSDSESGLPTTEVQCPECSNDRAYWYMQQIRAADESETRFFVCTECEHRWREDDH
ncbi:transcription factor S [Halobacteriales archaeon QH_8_64_26]|nr:MAG: transcription factor S [Halobacteriales archaeon QH_8_64_26]